jgi:polyhydroxybutyrate depolymerase
MQKLILTIFVFSILNISYAQYDSIPFGGYDRTYLVHLPIGYTGTTDLPLVLAMHGGFGNAYNLQNQSQLSIKADAENFIVVYPEGLFGGALNISSWNAGWCCGWASNNNIDDVGFINALLDTLIDQYSIDPNRVYATGMSNGGFMAYRLACELSDRIAAIAPVAASMSMTSCSPQRPVPIISFHSYLDTSVPLDGGVGDGPSNHHNSPQDSVLNAWSTMNGCSITNDTIVNSSQYLLRKWTDCDCHADVEQYVTQDGGHSWPGGNQTVIGDPVSDFIIANDLMWAFFQQYSLDCDPRTLMDSRIKNSRVELYPNPTRGNINIQSNIEFQEIEVTVFNLTGEKILRLKNQKVIEFKSIPAGTYFLSIETDDFKETHKIIKLE